MLATAGFLIAAVLLILFAVTFDRLVKDHAELKFFALAYLLVAAALLMWGVISLTSATSSLPGSVLVGDALLLAASICAASTYIVTRRKTILPVAGLIAFALLCIRGKQYYPEPALNNGVLFFHTQRPVAVLLSVVVAVAWLPACMKAAKVITVQAGLRRYYAFYVTAYALAVISAALFIEAQRRTVVIASFTAFALSILLLLVSNVLVMQTIGGRRAAG